MAPPSKSPRKTQDRPALTLTLAIVAVAVGAVLAKTIVASRLPPLPVASTPARAPHVAWQKSTPSEKSPSRPRISNVQVVDFDRDGTNDILVSDIARNSVFLYRSTPAGGWTEQLIAANLNTPAHPTVVDLDRDGDNDIVVAILGSIMPSDAMIGKVVLLRNDGGQFTSQVLLDDVYRVADVQAGDLDGDGDFDLAVAVFGYAHGEVLWLEQREPLQFRDHHLLNRPGTIHVPIGDYDGDGDLDIATIVSQDEEELWALENDGAGKFKSRRLWFTHNFDVGSGGLTAVDLDRDGDLDFLLPLGDNLENGLGWPQPYHGCVWFENQGAWKFAPRTIGQFGGTYAAAPGDIDGDGDTDVALVSMSNDWNDPRRPSVVWLENDGAQNFRTWTVDTSPVTLITAACGDLDGDGRADLVAGGLDMPGLPVNREQKAVTVWSSRKR